MRRAGTLLVVLLGLALLAGCAAPYDDDGEKAGTGALVDAAPSNTDATPVVVDTDVAGDDLVALAFLLRHPEVDVLAVTIAATGLVSCDAGVPVVRGLLVALGEPQLPIACGRDTAGPGARKWPADWRDLAESGTGITPVPGSRIPEAADELIADYARDVHGLVVVALGPLTNLADLAAAHPDDYARLTGVHAMAGSVDGPAIDGIAEWNVAADPESAAAVLTAPAPLTIVPEDAVPDGTPSALDSPVIGRVADSIDYPKWWDLSTAAALVVPKAGELTTGRWVFDDDVPGRLRWAGEGKVRVYRTLDRAARDRELAEVFPPK